VVQPAPEAADTFIQSLPAPAIEWWPNCAKASADLQSARDSTGTWYFAQYDFGCITVVISGERNSSTETPGAAQEDLSDKVADSASAADENNSGKPLSLTYSITRFHIPYQVTIECTEKSAEFCGDPAAQRRLLSRLSIIDGEPRP
jgi:hypothetical protein